MLSHPPLFDLHPLTFIQRKRRSEAEKLAEKAAEIRRSTYDRPAELFGRYFSGMKPRIPADARNRLYNTETTFWAFLGQVLSSDGSCRSAVQAVQSTAALRGTPIPSSDTAAYCRARARLCTESVLDMLHGTILHADAQRETTPGFEDHRVLVIDGTTVGLPDTPANQAAYPQSAAQKPGCGFPLARLLCAFYLDSGAVMDFALGNKHSGELGMLRSLRGSFRSGDVVLADRAFCGYCDIALLLADEVESVMRLHHARKLGRAKKRFSPTDKLHLWTRPRSRPPGLKQADWEAVPETMEVRVITVNIRNMRHRTKAIKIATTLTDAKAYPAEEIAALYLARWRAELHFREIKTTMGMETLKCKRPEMVFKELAMNLIAYNCVRLAIREVAEAGGSDAHRISFQSVRGALAEWQPIFEGCSARKLQGLLREFWRVVLRCVVPHRPNRREPRVLKRRHKNYQLMTKPRALMRETPHRSAYRAEAS